MGALTFNGNEGADFDRPMDTGEDNSYNLIVEATSGTGDRVQTATQTITVNVVNVNEPPGKPPAPLLTVRFEEPNYIVTVRPGGTPTNTGPDIGLYEIQYRAKGGFFWGSLYSSVVGDDWETEILGLINGITYEVRIQADNGEGKSEWSLSEITIPNQAPVVVGSIDAATGTVGGAVEIAYMYSVFSDPDGHDLDLQFTATSNNEAAATVQVIGFAVMITPVAAGNATITVTASDLYGETATTTFNATIQTPTLETPTLSISGDDFTIGFTDDFTTNETRAYEVRIRHKTPVGPWATGCFTKTETNEGQDISISETLSESDFFESGITYEADYGYIGANCNGSVTSRSEIVEATTSGTPSFDINLIFVGTVSSKYQSAFEAAATRWERIITHGIPYHPVSEEERDLVETFYPMTTIPDKVDDLLLLVEIDDDLRSGTLANAATLVLRDASFLPCIARILLNEDRLSSLTDEQLAKVMEHEIGHTLGFADWLWRGYNLLQNPSLYNPPFPDTHFSGPLAIEAFNAAGGASYTGAKVPVENNGISGGADSHWRESVLFDELMTTLFESLIQSSPLSEITIQAMADIGYRVDITQAESYLGPLIFSSKIASTSAQQAPLNCIVEGPIIISDKPAPIVLEVKSTGERR